MHTMNLKQLLADEEAVSPVIGVILMVAITVILAAVIGTFVLGLGDQVQTSAPQASFSFEYTDNSGAEDTLTITHDGGDKIKAGNLDIRADGSLSDSSGTSTNTGSSLAWETVSGGAAGDDVTAGSSITVYGDTENSNEDLSDNTVRVVWSDGDASATLARWAGPDA